MALVRAQKILLGVAGALVAGAGVLLVTRKSAAEEARDRGFASAVLERAQQDVGVVENASNSGVRVNQMLANVGVHFPANWCAAAVATWIREAAGALGVPAPIAGSASVLTTVQQLEDRNNPRVGWIDVAALRQNPARMRPGMVVAWSRGGASSGLGHIGVVESATGTSFATIEGNAGPSADRVVRSAHDLSSDSLLGMGLFNDGAIFAAVGVGYRNNPPGAALFHVV